MKLSLSDRAIIYAKDVGYTATESGEIFTPKGKRVTCTNKTKGGHIKLNLYIPGFNDSAKSVVLWHRFVAYYFHGEEMFKHRCVRHLDDNPENNRIQNLSFGSYKDNRGDIPKDRLSELARTYSAKSLVERNRKISDDMIREIRKYREDTGYSYKSIGDKFGLSAMTVYRAVKKISWREVN